MSAAFRAAFGTGLRLRPFWASRTRLTERAAGRRGTRRKARDRVFACQGYEGLDRIVMMRTPDWKLTRYDDGGGELYDLREDPHELRNLIDEPHYSSTVRRLTEEMDEWDDGHPHAEPQITEAMERANPERVRQIREAFKRWTEERADRTAVSL